MPWRTSTLITAAIIILGMIGLWDLLTWLG